MNVTVLINIHIIDSKDKAFLIGRDWLNRYQIDILYNKKEIIFRVQKQKFIIKLTTTIIEKQKVNYLGAENIPPPAYKPIIKISNKESEAETFISV